MATAVADRMEAARTLLSALKGSPAWPMASASQRDALVQDLRGAKVPAAQMAELAQTCQGLSWHGSDGDVVLKALFSGPSSAPRRTLQDYTQVLQFFSHAQWVFLQSEASSSGKLSLILEHCASLGLRCPTETTAQRLTALFLTLTEGSMAAKAMHHSQKLSVLRFVKKSFKEVAKGEPLAFVPALPAVPSELEAAFPELYQVVFKSSSPAACPLDMPAFMALCDGMAMRSSRRAPLLQVGSSDMSGGVAQIAKACMEQMQQMQQMQLQTLAALGAPLHNSFGARGWPAFTPDRARHPRLALNLGAPSLGNALGFDPSSAMEHVPLPITPSVGVDHNDETPQPAKRVELQEESPQEEKRPQALPVQEPQQQPEHDIVPETKKARLSLDDSVALIASSLRERNQAKEPKPKAQPKSQAGATSKAKTAEVARPYFNVERSRSQVMCRTGLRGPGSSFAIKYDEGGEAAAIKKAQKWVRDHEP